MKTILKITATFAMVITFAMNIAAQGITVATYVEHTSVSPKLGYMLGYTFDNVIPIEVGVFFQNEMMAPVDGPTEYFLKRRETSFAGAYFNYPAIISKKFDLYFQIRTGVVNTENFTITPSVEGRFKLLDQLHIGAGVGTRCFRPTAIGKVSWTF